MLILEGRVGVITNGAIKVITHQEKITQATLGGLFEEGKVIGFDLFDNGLTNDP